MTKREYFDRLISATRDGTFPSFQPGAGGVCSYRTLRADVSETRCAVGLLLDEAAFAEGCIQNNFGLENPEVREVVAHLLPNGATLDDAARIQRAHDSYYNVHKSAEQREQSHELFRQTLLTIPCFEEYSLAP